MDALSLRARRDPTYGIHPAGFTLIETLVAMAIASVLLAMATPAFQAVADSIRLTAASNAFLAHLYLARSEAIKRNGRVVVCKSPDGVACAATGGWDQGRIVFHDTNNNGVLDPGELVLASEGRLHPDLRMTGNTTVRAVEIFEEGTAR